jgi:multicomponent Na+:H+ antiporter subunit D
MSVEFPSALILIFGAALLPLLRGWMRHTWSLLLLTAAFAHLLMIPHGNFVHPHFLDYTLTLMRVDRLSLLFGYVFLIAAFLNVIYAMHSRDTVQHVAAMVYAGAALGAVFAGDLITLFIFWELTALTSVQLVWARRTGRAFRAGLRYFIVQLLSGMLLLAGAVLYASQTGSIGFEHFALDQPGAMLILLGFGIKCAFPLLHNWLQDAYPEATDIGTVVLSAFTTKLGIYALARGFAGTDALIYVGAAMAAFPIFYAVIENDLRRVLAYSVNNQLGFMVVGIGLGTELAINGAVAHAFADILFKALLFMSMGAVLLRTRTVNGSALGGLYKSMPWTTGFCIVGAASISAFPLFSGFVTKSMIMTATLEQEHVWVWLVLLFASAGVFHHAGIKIPFFTFFAHDSGIRCKEAPANMLVAMAIAAMFCVGIGSFPATLYAILPHPVDYEPYSASHVLSQLQLLVFSALAFAVLMRTGIYPPELRSVNLDFDWFYRRFGVRLSSALVNASSMLAVGLARKFEHFLKGTFVRVYRHHGPEGVLARSWPTGSMVLWVAILLASYLVVYYF